MKIKLLENEYWYGTCVKYGMKMPLHTESEVELDLTSNNTPNQAMPFLVSSKGRYLWRDAGFRINFSHGEMEFPEDVIIMEGFSSLKGAYLAAMKKHFQFHNNTPAEKLFHKVIYNTWIELTYFQNQRDVLEYAKNIIAHGMPAGVLMIDDGWSEYYGDWTFHSGKFPDAKLMIDTLHQMGFEVMVWLCPFISADTVAYREAVSKNILIKTQNGDPYIAKWWNGFSAVLDMTNPNAQTWLREQLAKLQAIGVDGFKFDAGDTIHYSEDSVTFAAATPNQQSQLWAKFGEAYEFNEYRVTYGAGGYGLLQRLCDKEHSWGDHGVASLIPDTLLQGITGHPYSCPDMIGGGEYLNFQEAAGGNLDQELFVRHSEIACLMPAIQFSAAPYRVLEEENYNKILKSLEVREQYIDYIMHCVNLAASTGEPVIRYLSYEFPEEPVEMIIDQFMLGDKYLVAPVSQKGCAGRNFYLPKGRWKYNDKLLLSKGEEIFLASTPGIPIICEKISCEKA
jgi:alpha-glucosidase (family GH31 glycosyl hydrolase)